jgi:hypothetical protein
MMIVTVIAWPDAESSIDRTHTGADGAADNCPDRARRAIAPMRALLSPADQALRLSHDWGAQGGAQGRRDH